MPYDPVREQQIKEAMGRRFPNASQSRPSFTTGIQPVGRLVQMGVPQGYQMPQLPMQASPVALGAGGLGQTMQGMTPQGIPGAIRGQLIQAMIFQRLGLA